MTRLRYLQRCILEARLHTYAGELRCLACGKALADHRTLAQHLKDAHGGLNAPAPPRLGLTGPEAPAVTGGGGGRSGSATGFSLGDLLAARPHRGAAAPRAPATAAPKLHEAPKSRGVQGTLRVRSWALLHTVVPMLHALRIRIHALYCAIVRVHAAQPDQQVLHNRST